MLHSVYEESFLPLTFFLHTIAVRCPSCHDEGVITTDVPAVFNQKKVTHVFDDVGTISYSPCYAWTTARFLCYSCQKRHDIVRENMLKTWHGPVLGLANVQCVSCKNLGYTQRLLTKKEYSSNKNLPTYVDIVCDKCHVSTRATWNFSPSFPSAKIIDPIFGLELLASMQIKNEVLWVYNLEHLQHIESYIKATQ